MVGTCMSDNEQIVFRFLHIRLHIRLRGSIHLRGDSIDRNVVT